MLLLMLFQIGPQIQNGVGSPFQLILQRAKASLQAGDASFKVIQAGFQFIKTCFYLPKLAGGLHQ